MATNVHLTPELENFTRHCVADGRFNNISEVVRAALRLLKDSEDRRQHFNAMLDVVRKEAKREGTFDADAVLAEMDEVIDVNTK